jgi:hypothetical protein
MLSERVLKQWRRDSLAPEFKVDTENKTFTTISINHILELHQRILRLTQELMDSHLIKKQL